MADIPVALTSVTVTKTAISWFKTHEVLIIAVLILGGWLGNKYLDNIATDAAAKAHTAEVAAQAATLQASQTTAAFVTALNVMQQQNAALAATVAKRQQVTETKVKDVTAPGRTATQAISDLNAAYDLNWDVAVEPSGRVSFQVPTVQTFAATKIERDADEATIADLNVELSNGSNALDACKTNTTALEAKNVADKKASDAEIASVKADANKSKRKYLIIGAAIYAIARGFLVGRP